MKINKIFFNKFLIFLYPIFFASPDLAINIGIINIRCDDIIVYILFIVNMKYINIELQFLFKNFFYKIHLFLSLYAIFSMLIVILIGYDNLIDMYQVIRFIGSLPYIIVLPYLLSFKEYRKAFYIGAFFAGILYILFLYSNYTKMIDLNLMDQFKPSSLKKNISFSTLNPNAVASISVIIAWINILGYFEHKRKVVLIIAFVLMFVPIFIFARGMSFGVIVAFIFLFFSSGVHFKNILLFLFLVILFYILILNFVDIELLTQATNINVETGEGFSNRYLLWTQGLDLIMMSPLYGLGFATENGQYIKYFYGHMSHNVYIHYLIELGFIGFFLFLSSIVYVIYNRYKKEKRTKDFFYKIQIAILLSFLVTDLSDQLLYFNKYAFIVYILSLINKREVIRK